MGEMIIEKAGLFDTIQDTGRIGFQKYGVPQAGAMDSFAFQIGNLLAGNPRNTPSLEMTLLGGTFRFTEPATIALTGADLSAKLNGNPVSPWKAYSVNAGDIVVCRAARSGCRAYLAVQGGFNVPKVLSSFSTYTKGKLGGFEGNALLSGARLSYATGRSTTGHQRKGMKASPPLVSLSHSLRPQYKEHQVLRVILGPQEEYFTKRGISTFLEETYTVSPQMDRMGLRLQGSEIEWSGKGELLSDSIPFGGIQVPANGQPILLMADRQTTGGYPKIATIITVDLPKVAQLRPNQTVRFESVSMETAQGLYRAEEQMLRSLALVLQQR